MTDIGIELRQAREARGLSLDQVQKATRIKRVFLEAIEAGRIDELPGPVQARGFIRSYAGHLGLDPDALLAQVDGALSHPSAGAQSAGSFRPNGTRAANMPAPRPVFPTSTPAPQSLPLPILIVGVVVLFIIGGLLLIKAFGGEAPAPTPTLPASVPLSANRTAQATPTPSAPNGVSLTLTASEHVWLRVTQDGFTAFEGLMAQDEAQTWQAEQQVIVETGNGGALTAAVNGRDIGVIGPRGRIVVRAWGADGEVTPAPTAAPTAAVESTVEPGATTAP
jgi:cytoskeletal protein RodZ